MVNTVILGDCLYKKSSVLSTLQNYCFSGIYASTQNSHFTALAAIKCSYLAMLSPLTRINTSLAILDMPLLPLQRTYVSGRGVVAVRSRF